jgi:SAM-dependent methyltransferase
MHAECPACGARESDPWRLAHAVRAGGAPGEGFQLRRCSRCGTAWIPDSIPADAGLYETGPYAQEKSVAERAPILGGLFLRDRLRLLGPITPRSRVIEVGAGRGTLLASLRARGHRAVGIEPFGSLNTERGQDPPVQRVRLEEASFPDSDADLVIFWHVLEHLEHPAGALEKAAHWLRPGGRLVTATPNLGSLQARLGGDRWFHQDVPRHRTQFTAAGLRSLIARSGFEPTTTRHLMLEQNVPGMWLTLLNRTTHNRDVPYRLLKRDLTYARRFDGVRDTAAAVLFGIPLLPVAALVELGAGLMRSGGTVVIQGELR